MPEFYQFMAKGGPAMWAIGALSVLTLTVILWKLWRLLLIGAWRRAATEQAVGLWVSGDQSGALAVLSGRSGVRSMVARAAMGALRDGHLNDQTAREEVMRVAKSQLQRVRGGLRILELVATIAPLIGLLGTVLGMIEAFQALQEAGSRADPAALAGGIWEALLTTAAGMTVAIPASMALTWFESIADTIQTDMEDAATRIFGRGRG